MLLVLNTSSNLLTVALADPDKGIIAEHVQQAKQSQSDLLMPAIELLVDGDHLQGGLHLLKAIITCNGPGSFTGIRIGLAVANTFAWSLDIPVVGISSLDALAQHALTCHSGRLPSEANEAKEDDPESSKTRESNPSKILSCINAGRDETYIAQYEPSDKSDKLVQRTKESWIHPIDQLHELNTKDTLLIGIFPSKYQESLLLLTQADKNLLFFDQEPNLAVALFELGMQKLAGKINFKATGQASPMYIREAHITKSKKPIYFSQAKLISQNSKLPHKLSNG